MRYVALIGCGLAFILAGCGGSSGSTGSTEASASLRTSKQTFQCLYLAGFKPVPDTTRFGALDLSGGRLPGYVNGLAMKLPGASKPVIVSFYSSDSAAGRAHHEETVISEGTSGGSATSGNVVVWHAVKVSAGSLKKIEACAFK